MNRTDVIKLTEDQKLVVAEMHAMLKAQGGVHLTVEERIPGMKCEYQDSNGQRITLPREDNYRIRYLSADKEQVYECLLDISEKGRAEFWAQKRSVR